MPLVLYNTLTRRKEAFVPIDPQNVRMYVCGPTVYETPHIGNARAVVVFDQLYRVLRHEYGAAHVKYVRNITDIDDKIIEAARAGGEPISALTERTTAAFHADMAALGALTPDVEPRCTGHVPQMVQMIERLIASGHAYAAEGHVLFAVRSWPRYGKLSRRSTQEMIAGARVEVAPYKKDPGDFVLWKPSTPEQPGWESPWGRGRPGWHIECSAMSEAHLGEHFDIHGGGLDLIFPHHENELAQSEAAHGGEKFVNLWMHNGFLSVDSTKMSKSLGNFVTVHELLKEWPGEMIRLALLGTHYRDPLDWTEDRRRQAVQDHSRLAGALNRERRAGDPELPLVPAPSSVIEALHNDLNTPLALARLHELAHAINRCDDERERRQLKSELKAGGQLMGLLDPEAYARLQPTPRIARAVAMGGIRFGGAAVGVSRLSDEIVEERTAARTEARKERRFADADRIRAELAQAGIILEDKPDGTTEWRRA
ncbi:MAG TPA: cysteine--tRNA ligase [Stellaceae bacterium]|nr:cysteine--tRNA ligase [Stellaceae bacterium]